MTRATLLVPPLVLALAGCGGNQNTLDPAGDPERSIAQLFWVMFGVAIVGFGLIVLLLFLGWWRRERPDLPGGRGERTATRIVLGFGVALPIVLLTALFIWSDFFVMRSTAAPAKGSTALTIHVTGHQWWWEVRYAGSTAVTANEIHIPTDTRVEVVLTTADVIHSFWVPQLNRKADMIPGSANRLLLVADRPGIYRGQCAEFCGLQHANMAVEVVAQPKAAFDAWLARNARPAAHGNALFAENCSGCHEIRGTTAHATVGPDLTHFASRRTIAAVTMPNTPENLRDWLRDPQHAKPGNLMPKLELGDTDWDALQRYLESLR
jgi:cytochrome c oxidase subunit 2